MKIKVKVIEKDKNRCEFLSEELTDATIINGDGTDRSLLLEEGLESAESFVTLTNMDEENIFLSLFAKTISNAKLVAGHRKCYLPEIHYCRLYFAVCKSNSEFHWK